MVLQNIKDRPRREVEGSPFEKAPNLEVIKIGVVKFYSCWSNLTGGQGRGQNEFVKSNFHQLDEPSVCISILQNTSTSSEFISGKHLATVQNRQSGTFCKELAKTGKRSYDTGYSKRLRNPFYFAAKAIKATKSVSINQTRVRPSGSASPGYVEERCYSTFGSQSGLISQLFVSCKKERWGVYLKGV